MIAARQERVVDAEPPPFEHDERADSQGLVECGGVSPTTQVITQHLRPGSPRKRIHIAWAVLTAGGARVGGGTGIGEWTWQTGLSGGLPVNYY
ncbi:MAG: hypothetical protein ACHP84_05765 [Caulobacterales bacterium]